MFALRDMPSDLRMRDVCGTAPHWDPVEESLYSLFDGHVNHVTCPFFNGVRTTYGRWVEQKSLSF